MPAKIIENFGADLSRSSRNGGSDEHHYAFYWFQRQGYVEDRPYGYNEALDWVRFVDSRISVTSP